jgi:hypothetical protein
MIDKLVSGLHDDVHLIIDPDETERASALAVALATRHNQQRVGEVSSERSAERLRQLSDELGRIAATLAGLSAGPSAPMSAVAPIPSTVAAYLSDWHRMRAMRCGAISRSWVPLP